MTRLGAITTWSTVASVELKGVATVQRNLRSLGLRAPVAVGRALRRLGEEIMTDAKLLTPVDTGALRASGHVQGPTLGPEVAVTLGFGGPSAPYAVYVHERLDLRHPVGQAKFLEEPFKAKASQIPERIAAEMRAEVARAAR